METARQETPLPVAPMLTAVSRGLALFIGGFTLLNLLWELRTPGFDGNLWWIDLHSLSVPLAQILLALSAGYFIAYGLFPIMGPWRRQLTIFLLLTLAMVTLWNGVVYEKLLARQILYGGLPVPFSFVLAVVLLLSAFPLLRGIRPKGGPKPRKMMALTLLVCLIGFPLAQIYFFGTTDYRRPADVIVVFGALAYADGTLSAPLYDRVQTACRLYQAGYAPLLIFSGGPSAGDMYEAEAMRRMAVEQGVPNSAVLLDREGLDTRATVHNTVPIFRKRGIRQVITVSQFYHLPRIKMAYRREGYDVITVPAAETHHIDSMPWLLTREVVALWAYYVGG